MSGGVVSGPATRTVPPDPDDAGMVVRPIGPIGPVIPLTATTGAVTSVPAAIVATPLLAANPARLGFSIRNTSTADTLYVLAANAGAVSPALHTVALVPGAYYEDPYHYVGPVTGVWAPAATGTALVDEYT